MQEASPQGAPAPSRFGAAHQASRGGRANANAPPFERWGVLYRALAMTYFLTGNPQYHRRDVVSRSCSGWEGVGPTRYGRQEFWKKVEVLRLCIAPCDVVRVIGSPPARG